MTVPSQTSTRRAPAARFVDRNTAPTRPDGDYVLYWMTAARRSRRSFALDRAVALAREFSKPLVVLEALRCDYLHASDRLHQFVLDGMRDQRARFDEVGVHYHPYVEPAKGAGKGLLSALAARACVVVTDEFPSFFLPHMVEAAAGRLDVRLESVDGNGLLPLRATERVFPSAYAFRRYVQIALPTELSECPRENPFDGPKLPRLAGLPPDVLRAWPRGDGYIDGTTPLAQLAIDHAVRPTTTEGGSTAAARALREFVASALAGYDTERNDPDARATSRLSPYLHFGHLSVHDVFAAVMEQERWTPSALSAKVTGRRTGWWGVSPAAEAYLDQVVTWRELSLNYAHFRPDECATYQSVPLWARAALDRRRSDVREYIYTRAQFEAAATHDEVWNAAQRELLRDGRIHNYLRMLWGKKVIEWSATPEDAAATLLHLNDKYALDGRDPNSYAGIFWCFGRYDRPWGPARNVFGSVRYMSCAAAERKLSMEKYLLRNGPQSTESV